MKVGIELGITAKFQDIYKAGRIARDSGLNYYVPETVKEKFGVDAFETINGLASSSYDSKFGTMVVNVFSKKERILSGSQRLYSKVGKNAVIGLGVSTPELTHLNKLNYRNPVGEMIDKTLYVKSKNKEIPIYWAALGKRMLANAAKYADGASFFCTTEKGVKDRITFLAEELDDKEKNFTTVNIRPVYLTEDEKEWKKLATKTFGKYFAANKNYRADLKNNGFSDFISSIEEHGFSDAPKVEEKIPTEVLEELTDYGTPDQIAEKIYRHKKRTGVDEVIMGIDYPRYDLVTNSLSDLARSVRDI